MTGFQHPAVVVQFSVREASFFRLNSPPFDGEAVSVEAEIGQQIDVLLVEVIVIARIPRRLLVHAVGKMLEQPGVAIEVIAFHLVSSGRGAPQELRRKAFSAPSLVWACRERSRGVVSKRTASQGNREREFCAALHPLSAIHAHEFNLGR